MYFSQHHFNLSDSDVTCTIYIVSIVPPRERNLKREDKDKVNLLVGCLLLQFPEK